MQPMARSDVPAATRTGTCEAGPDEPSVSEAPVTVDLGLCVRCAACSSLAPRVFEVTSKGTRVARQPDGAAERALCRAAALICPTQAIGAAP
jgi:ferredoxin